MKSKVICLLFLILFILFALIYQYCILINEIEIKNMKYYNMIINDNYIRHNNLIRRIDNILKEKEDSWVKDVSFFVNPDKTIGELINLDVQVILDNVPTYSNPKLLFWSEKNNRKEIIELKNLDNIFITNLNVIENENYYYQIYYEQENTIYSSSPNIIPINYFYQRYQIEYSAYKLNREDIHISFYPLKKNTENSLNISNAFLLIKDKNNNIISNIKLFSLEKEKDRIENLKRVISHEESIKETIVIDHYSTVTEYFPVYNYNLSVSQYDDFESYDFYLEINYINGYKKTEPILHTR